MKYGSLTSAAVLIAAVSASAAAQTPATPPPAQLPAVQARQPESARAKLDRALEGITLSAEVRARIDSIHARHTAMMPAVPAGGQPDSTAKAQIRAHTEAALAEIRALLTPQQRAVWDRNVAAMGAAAPARP